MNQFRFIDLFAGIGGFRLGLEAIGGVCVASSEIDKNAIQVYQQNWNDSEHHNLGDICQITQLPKHDLLVGGVPCQSWSIAGKNRGIEDPRGQLWNEVIRLLEQNKPTAFLFENVKGLADPRHRDSLNYLVNRFESIGYNVNHRLLNSYDYGVPQNRNRIFIVGIQKNRVQRVFAWPKPVEMHQRLHDIFDNLEKPPASSSDIPIQRNLFGERVLVGHNKLTPIGSKNKFFIMIILKNRRKPKYGPQDGNPISFADLSALIPDLIEEELQSLVSQKILRQYEDGRYEFFNRKLSGGIDGVYRVYLPSSTFFPTLMASGTLDFVATVNIDGETDAEYKHNFISQILEKGKYRLLKPVEMARLQGFPDDFMFHENDKKNVKLFGNSMAVPVVEAVGKAIVATGCFKRNIIGVEALAGTVPAASTPANSQRVKFVFDSHALVMD